MKLFSFLLLLMTTVLFSQQKQLFSDDLKFERLQILTDNLDDLIIENSSDEKLEIVLENDNSFPINIKTKTIDKELIVSFEKESEIDFNSSVFRKYITKRLERARVLVKVPVEKNITVIGKNVGVVSRGYQGNVSIYIDKGNVKLGHVKGKTSVHLFLGNVYAHVDKTNIRVKTTNGILQVNNKVVENDFVESNLKNIFSFSVNSINANIYLTKK